MKTQIISLALIIAACGSEDGQKEQEKQSQTVASISQNVGMEVKQMTYECPGEDIPANTAPGFSIQNVYTIQDGIIEISVTDAQAAIGEQQAEEAELVLDRKARVTGVLNSDKTFLARGSTTGRMGDSGPMVITVLYDGRLTESGWEGTYTQSYYFEELFMTCNFSGEFTGKNQ